MMKITAYADRISAAPGETIKFMVNSEAPAFKADIVKLICGDMNPDGPGYKEKMVKTGASGKYKGRRQVIHAGSFVEIDASEAFQNLESFTLQAFIWPTMPAKGRQAIIANWSDRLQTGACLSIAADNSGVELVIGAGKRKVQSITTGKPLLAHEWYFIAASFDAKSKNITLVQEPLHTHELTNDTALKRHKSKVAKIPGHPDPVIIGAQFKRRDKGRTVCTHHFNGKIDSPRIVRRANPDSAG